MNAIVIIIQLVEVCEIEKPMEALNWVVAQFRSCVVQMFDHVARPEGLAGEEVYKRRIIKNVLGYLAFGIRLVRMR